MNELELRDKHDRERIDTILRQAASIEALEAALRDILKVTNDDDEPDWLNTIDRINEIARTALAPEQDT